MDVTIEEDLEFLYEFIMTERERVLDAEQETLKEFVRLRIEINTLRRQVSQMMLRKVYTNTRICTPAQSVACPEFSFSQQPDLKFPRGRRSSQTI